MSNPTPSPHTTAHASTVELHVGAKHFFVEKSLLCESSDYFRNALTGPWREARYQIITLDEEDPVVVDVYVDWLVTNRITIPERIGGTSRQTNQASACLFVELYVFGDRRIDRRFRNDTISALVGIAVERRIYPWQMLGRLCGEAPIESRMRRLLSEFWAFAGRPKWLRELAAYDDDDDIDNSWRAVVFAHLEGHRQHTQSNRGQFPWTKKSCAYHEHVPGEECRDA